MLKKIFNSNFLKTFKKLLFVLGPAIIILEADNDVGAVTSYVQSGATYGLSMIWVMLLLLPITYFCQEMSMRIGICAKEGLISIIKNKFGKFWANLSISNLLIVNFLTIMTEFAGITLVSKIIGISPFISLPISMFVFVWLVFSSGYKKWEKIMIGFCFLDIAWIFMSYFSHPMPLDIVKGAIPNIPHGGITKDYVFLIMSLCGTTITTWQLVGQAACVLEKKINVADIKIEKLETLLGSIFTILVAAAMIVIGSLSYKHGLKFEDPASMAQALSHWYPWLKNLVLIMIINASMLGTVAVSLSSSWAISDNLGNIQNFNKKFKDAPWFYMIYLICVVGAGSLCLIPKLPLNLIILGVQVLSCISLPYFLVFLHIILNDKELVGEKYINKPWQNVVNISIIITLCILSIILLLQVLAPSLFK